MHLPAFALSSLLLVATAACDSQPDPDPGDGSLASIEGRLVNEFGREPGELDLVILWERTLGNEGDDTAEAAYPAVDGELSGTFRIALDEPPPEVALNDLRAGGQRPDEVRFGVGFVLVVSAGYVLTEDGPPPDEIGVAERSMIFYAEEDVGPGSQTAERFGVVDAGFHLVDVLDVDDPACADEDFDCLREREDGLDAPIEIRLAPIDDLDFPSWT